MEWWSQEAEKLGWAVEEVIEKGSEGRLEERSRVWKISGSSEGALHIDLVWMRCLCLFTKATIQFFGAIHTTHACRLLSPPHYDDRCATTQQKKG